MSFPSSRTMVRIQETVARQFKVTVAELTGPRRPANLAWARQVAMYLCRETNGIPYQSIGRAFGDRDHATVMHACRKVQEAVTSDDKTQGELEQILAALANG
jgi:chromosomal replication initiator protein